VKNISFVLCLSFIVVLPQVSTAAGVSKFEENKTYKSAKIFFKNSNRIIKTNQIIIADGTVTFKKQNQQLEESVPLADLRIIKVPTGSYVGEYALYGGVLMGLSAVLGVIQGNADLAANGYETVDGTPLIIGFTAAGAGVGAIWGLATEKWQVLYYSE